MRPIVIVWYDRDGTSTTHEFASPPEAEPWLRSVLGDHVPTEDLEADGYTPDGFGMLEFYRDEGCDDVGQLEVFVDGVAAEPADLYG